MRPLDIARLRQAFPGRRIDYYEAVDSTMHAAAGLALGSVVLAEHQLAGQGRHGHSWQSEPYAGIYSSVVMEPAPVLTLALGLAAQSAIREAAGIECDIRWPNDLMLGGKKTGGILVTASGAIAIAGIGINVSQASFPAELEPEATSLAQWRGSTDQPAPSRVKILLALLPAIDEFASFDQKTILRLFTQASSYVSGRRVTVNESGRVIEGVTNGLDGSGFLKVRKDDGTDTLILAGGVRATGS